VRFVLATGNAHKLTEFRRILAPHEVLPMPAWVTLPPEGADSFAENARGKALALAQALRERGEGEGLWCLGDDSGLQVEALEWAPGVTSARYAGVDGPGADAANVTRLLRELVGCAGPLARRARFVCTVCAISPDLAEHAVTGHWWGAIAEAPRGAGGFGYDPHFRDAATGMTGAELPLAQKNELSHRGKAMRALIARLKDGA